MFVARHATAFLLVQCCLAATNPTAHAQVGNSIQISGYSSFEFEKQLSAAGRGDPNASFDADLFDLVLNFRPTANLRVAADLTWEHGAATEDNRGNVAVEYAFAEYTVADALRFRAGKMFVHFGIYNEIHTAKPAFLTVKEPFSTNKNHKFGSAIRFYPRWAVGITGQGNASVEGIDLDYIVQLTNGEQESTNPFEEDDNIQKSLAARVRLWPLRDLRVSVSFYQDYLTELDSVGDDTGERTHLMSLGASADWNLGNLGLELEYVGGFVHSAAAASVTRHAITAMASYVVFGRLTPYLRVEWLDPDTALDDDRATLWIYGVNLQVTGGLFLKAELNTTTSGANNARFAGTGFTELKAAVAVGF